MPRAICLVILIALAGASEVRPQVAPRNKPEEKPKACPLPPDDPLTLGQVVNAVVEFPKCVQEWVRKRSVKFKATPDIVELLNDIQAPPGLLALIPPPPPPPKVAGPLTVVCEPKDCEVILNDRDYGFTQEGKKVISDLAPGRQGVQARRDGYEVRTGTIDLAEGAPQELKFSLRPNGLARREQGRDRVLQVAGQFGGMPGLFELADDLVVRGTASLLDENKKSQEWDTVFQQKWNRVGFHFGVKAVKPVDFCDISISGAAAVSSECKGKLKGKAEPVLSKTALLLARYQVQALLAELLSRDVELVESEDPAATRIKTVGEAADSYEVSFDPKGFPSVIQYRSKPDANPIQIEYSSYSMVEGHQYPHRIKISETSPDRLLVDFTIASAARPPSLAPPGKKK